MDVALAGMGMSADGRKCPSSTRVMADALSSLWMFNFRSLVVFLLQKFSAVTSRMQALKLFTPSVSPCCMKYDYPADPDARSGGLFASLLLP